MRYFQLILKDIFAKSPQSLKPLLIILMLPNDIDGVALTQYNFGFSCNKNFTYSVYVILTCNQCLTRETNIMAIILLIILPLRNTRWTILNTYMLYVLTALLHAQLCACVEVSLNMCFFASRDPLQLQPNTKIFYSGENHHAQKTKRFSSYVHMGYNIACIVVSLSNAA